MIGRRGPFSCADARVGVQGDEELALAAREPARRLEVGRVPGMQEVEDAVRQDEGAAGCAPSLLRAATARLSGRSLGLRGHAADGHVRRTSSPSRRTSREVGSWASPLTRANSSRILRCSADERRRDLDVDADQLVAVAAAAQGRHAAVAQAEGRAALRRRRGS